MTKSEVEMPREDLFVPVTLENPIFCADKRSAVDADVEYIHLLGGAANPPFNISVIKEVNTPHSVVDTLDQEVADGIKAMQKVGLTPGVHSDTTAENGKVFQIARTEGPVGCKYLEFRAAISRHLVADRMSIITQTQDLFPSLFTGTDDEEIADKVVDAHERLLAKEDFFSTGREIATQAAEEGAATMLVDSADDAPVNTGIINEQVNTSFQTTEASNASLSAYDHDSWANRAIFAKMRDQYPYEERQFAIAEAIDAVATMAVLGVEHLEVRK